MIPTHQTSLKPLYIVGAGPGDPDLITVKGRNLLAQADVVIYTNSLVPKQMLSVCRADAELIATANKTLEEIIELEIVRVRSQLLVVRLHDGDPSLYGAIHEQIAALVAAEIPFEVVPGVSAYQLAAARLQVELTIPELVQTIILTRISGRTQVPDKEELSSLAAHQASLCLYLSARHVENAQAQLLAHYPADTTVAICYRLGWEDEKILLVPLTEMATVTHQEDLVRTTLYVVSPALGVLKERRQLQYAAPRSRLYHPEHDHLFRNAKRSPISS